MNIVNLNDMRPHLSGEARCLQCNHEWHGIALVGTEWLECPECKTEKGVLKYPVIRRDYLHYICNCGNDLFCHTDKGDYCPKCGNWCD